MFDGFQFATKRDNEQGENGFQLVIDNTKMFIHTSFSNNKAGDKHNTSFPHEWNQNT